MVRLMPLWSGRLYAQRNSVENSNPRRVRVLRRRLREQRAGVSGHGNFSAPTIARSQGSRREVPLPSCAGRQHIRYRVAIQVGKSTPFVELLPDSEGNRATRSPGRHERRSAALFPTHRGSHECHLRFAQLRRTESTVHQPPHGRLST